MRVGVTELTLLRWTRLGVSENQRSCLLTFCARYMVVNLYHKIMPKKMFMVPCFAKTGCQLKKHIKSLFLISFLISFMNSYVIIIRYCFNKLFCWLRVNAIRSYELRCFYPTGVEMRC